MTKMKHTRRWLTLAVVAATMSAAGQAYATAPTVSDEQMAFNQPVVSTEVSAQEKEKQATLEQKGLVNNPSLAVGGQATIDATGAQALYVSRADQATIDAQEGKTVTKVSFVGVPDEYQAKLTAMLATKVGDKVSREKIDEDIAAIGNSGLFAQITPVFTTVPEGVQLAYHLTANPTVNQIHFDGVTVFDANYLAQMMAVPKGSVLNSVTVGEKVREIENLYLNQGYILAGVTDVSVQPDGTLHVGVAEGVVEDIVIKGNKKTKDYVIKRELRIMKGQPFNKFYAQRSLERLYNLGYFEDVNVRLLPGKAPHTVVVEIDVLEQKTGVVTVGAGYSKSDGFIGIVEFGENNFRGTGDKINVHWEFGGSGHGKNYQVSYTRPWLDSKGTSLGFSFYDRVVEYDDYNEKGDTVATYDKRKKGWNITLGRAQGEYRTTYLTFESRDDKYDAYKQGFNYAENGVYAAFAGYEKNKDGKEEYKLDSHGNKIPVYVPVINGAGRAEGFGLPPYPELTGKADQDKALLDKWKKDTDATLKGIQEQVEKNPKVGKLYNFRDMDYIGKNFGRTNSVSVTHVFDSRDNYFNPSRGHRYSVTGQWAGHGLGGDFDFYKISAEGRFYKKVGSKQVLALRLIGGYASGELSYSELFSLGGPNNLRGFEDDQFKGNKMYSATLEYRFPIMKKVDGVVFTDVGNAWGIDKTRIPWYHDSNKVHWSAGVGVRLQTPIGPIRLDYAHGDKNKFHFSFGGQF